jgi:uncharacterized membrane protein
MRAMALIIGLTLSFGVAHAQSPGEMQIPPTEPVETFSRGEVVSQRMMTGEDGAPTLITSVRIQDGPFAGTTFTQEDTTPGAENERQFTAGQTVVVQTIAHGNGELQHIMRDSYRLPSLGWLFAVFLVIAFLFGGRVSLMAVLGLLVSIGILIFLVLPMIVNGRDPMLSSLFGCALIACTSLFLAHGFSRRTMVALLSTLVTLAIAAVLAVIFVKTGKLFGMGSEESFFLQNGALGQIDLRGLLLGGILIGCLGVLDDITTAQTAAVEEISKANPSLSAAQLRTAGFSVGKEHISSLINTLALAYAGASLPLLLLFHTDTEFPLWVTLNSEFIAEEIVRTLVGSATLLFAVPLSTWFASSLLRAAPGSTPRTGGHSHSHAHSHA